jgi:O-antigen/teichoic acid export membrane protein
MTPFMIGALGDKLYGLWMLVASLTGFYGLLNLGLTSAVQRYLAKAIGKNDYKEANVIFNTSFFIFLIIGFISFLVTIIIVFLAPLFVKSPEDINLFRYVIILYGVSLAAGFPIRAFWGVFSSHLRYKETILIDIINVIIKSGLIIIVLKLGYGIIAVAVVNLATDLLWYFANAIYALKIATYVKISPKYCVWGKTKLFFNYSIFSFISQIASKVKFDIDNYVISAFVGLSSITTYAIGIRLIRYFSQFVSRAIEIMIPVFSQYDGAGDYRAIKKYMFFSTKISIYYSLLLAALLIFLGKAFIIWWVGDSYHEAYIIIIIMITPYVSDHILNPSNQMLYGVSKHKSLAILNVCEAIANLTLSLIFVHIWGIKGVALGTAIPLFVTRTIFNPILVCNYLKMHLLEYYGILLLTLSKALLCILIAWLFTYSLPTANIFLMILAGALFSIIYIPLIFIIGFTTDEKKYLLNILHDFRHPKVCK